MPKFLDVTDPAAARARLGLDGAALSVTAYGAIGDGVADDTAAIHEARDAAGIGGAVAFPPGTYLVDGLTASVVNQTWTLADGAVIKMKTGAAKILNVTGDGVSVHGGIFDGSNGTAHDGSQDGLVIKADSVTVEGVTVQNSPHHGIVVYNHSNVSVHRCTAISNYYGGIACFNYLSAPSTITNITFTENLVDHSSGPATAEGIAVRGFTTTQRVKNVVVSGNTVLLPSNQVIQTGGIAVHTCTDYVCSNNVIMGSNLGITNPLSINGVISGNVVKGFKIAGIELPGDCDGVTIAGNTLDPDGTEGSIGVWTSSGTLTNASIIGNVFKNFAPSSDPVLPIAFSTNSVVDRVTIANNTMVSSTSVPFKGVYCKGAVTNLSVTGNVMDASATASAAVGVELIAASSGITVSGNQFKNLKTAGLRMLHTSGTCSDIKLSGNVYVNSGPKIANNSSGTAVVSDNVCSDDVGVPGATSTATAAGTTTLTVKSTEAQIFTGTTTQTCVLPTTSIVLGQKFTVINNSTGVVTVNSSSGSLVAKLTANSSDTFTALRNTPTASTHWAKYSTNSPSLARINDTNGNTSLLLNAATNAVNHVQVNNTAATGAPSLTVAGPDTDISFTLRPKNAGAVSIYDGSGAYVARFRSTASAVNYWNFYNSAAGSTIYALAAGSDSNINVNVYPKGTGTFQVNDKPVAVKVSVPASATATGVVGQWAADASFIYICTATDTWKRAAIAAW